MKSFYELLDGSRRRCFQLGFSLILALVISLVMFYCDMAWADGETPWIDSYEQEIYIKAINPGYTKEGKSNAGEMVEIARKSSGEPIMLAGIAVRYTNSSGNTSILLEFPENSYLIGESIILRLASAPEAELANLNYGKTLAMKGGVELVKGEEVLDGVCWTGKAGCYKEFVSSKPTSLVRNETNGQFEHLDEYESIYDALAFRVETAQEEEGFGRMPSQCKSVQFSEVLSYYETVKSEQFIELFNLSSEQVLLDGCQIRYKNKNYRLEGMIGAEEYYAYYPIDFSLTKNPTNQNVLELIDVDGNVVDEISYPNGQRKGASYAWVGYNEAGERIWRVTYAPTPGSGNNYQEFKTCEEGKVINEATGNCVKVSTIAAAKICPEGQYLNILTGRCKKYVIENEKTCKEGYYLNPETGRCRKIVENKSADYGLEPEKYEEKSSFIALYLVIGVIGLGVVYLCYEFRRDIKRWVIGVWNKLR